MAEPCISPRPALLVIAAFSRHMQALEWACDRLQTEFGPVAFESFPYRFSQTAYYEPTMGPELWKVFLAFSDLVALDCLPETKLKTNAIEAEIARDNAYLEVRPLNLDPGVLTLGKFMLATTKDQSHRIYLGNGIFAEVTLRFKEGRYEGWPWTYADYLQPEVTKFLGDVRQIYAEKLRHALT